MCAKKTLLTPSHCQQQPKPLIKGRVDAYFLVYSKFRPCTMNAATEKETHQTRLQSAVVWWACGNWSLGFLFLAGRSDTGVWSSAAAFHLLQSSIWRAFRDALLLTLVLKSSYSSYCYLPIGLKPSGNSHLTSDRNKAFAQKAAAHWIFLLFRTVLCKP